MQRSRMSLFCRARRRRRSHNLDEAEVAEERVLVEGASGEIPEEEAEGEVRDKSPMSNAITVGNTAIMQEIAGPRRK